MAVRSARRLVIDRPNAIAPVSTFGGSGQPFPAEQFTPLAATIRSQAVFASLSAPIAAEEQSVMSDTTRHRRLHRALAVARSRDRMTRPSSETTDGSLWHSRSGEKGILQCYQTSFDLETKNRLRWCPLRQYVGCTRAGSRFDAPSCPNRLLAAKGGSRPAAHRGAEPQFRPRRAA